jgi:nitric oxide reductase subunit B
MEARADAHNAVWLHSYAYWRRIHLKTRAPIPDLVIAETEPVLFTAADIQDGQELFRKRNLMNYGSVLGHGAYLGPDYTAEALHWMTEAMRAERSGGLYASLSIGQKGGIDAEVAAELKQNRYDERAGTLTFTPGQT